MRSVDDVMRNRRSGFSTSHLAHQYTQGPFTVRNSILPRLHTAIDRLIDRLIQKAHIYPGFDTVKIGTSKIHEPN